MSEIQPLLSDEKIQFLHQEMERMQSLYSQAQDNVQNVFNFYLTLVTTVIGAIVVLLQITPTTTSDTVQTRLIFIGLLFFTGLVGTVYLSSLSGRYAHAARYARAIDEIRYYLIQNLNVPLPTLYNQFLQDHQTTAPAETISWWMWILPTGTYQMFIAIVNSLAFALMAGVFASLGDVNLGYISLVMAIIFVLVYNVYNIYSRFVIRAFQKQLHVRIHTGNRLAGWASRE